MFPRPPAGPPAWYVLTPRPSTAVVVCIWGLTFWRAASGGSVVMLALSAHRKSPGRPLNLRSRASCQAPRFAHEGRLPGGDLCRPDPVHPVGSIRVLGDFGGCTCWPWPGFALPTWAFWLSGFYPSRRDSSSARRSFSIQSVIRSRTLGQTATPPACAWHFVSSVGESQMECRRSRSVQWIDRAFAAVGLLRYAPAMKNEPGVISVLARAIRSFRSRVAFQSARNRFPVM